MTNSQPYSQLVCIGLALFTGPGAMASDFATSVVAYTPGTGIPFDSINGLPFNDPSAALGPPTIDTTGDGIIAPLSAALPILPVHPAFRQSELVSIGSGGSLTLAFDHPVLDDPDNPYGIDVIVFGNAWLNLTQPSSWQFQDPALFTLGSTLLEEPGSVSVSADGSNWFECLTGPSADSFAPTLGRIYDPDAPAILSGVSNEWWGSATDPTFPLDPLINHTSFAGTNLAYAATAYGTSAGGAGFDIAQLDLPVDPATGHKYFRFLRIDNSGSASPEVDAVADVAPRSNQTRWFLDQFSWQQRATPGLAGPDDDPDGDNLPNTWEYLHGTDPLLADSNATWHTSMTHADDQTWLLASYPVSVTATDVTAQVQSSTDLKTWSTNDVVQHWTSSMLDSNRMEISAALPGTNETTFLRLHLLFP